MGYKPVLEADEEKLTRLLLILLDNAIKYSSKGKVVSIKGLIFLTEFFFCFYLICDLI